MDTGITVFSVNVSGSYYQDEYGLPGPVAGDDTGDSSRRKQTDFPEDDGETTEAKARFGFDMDLQEWGTLSLKRGYLLRENRYILGFSPRIPRSSQKDKIDEDTRQLDLNYLKYYSFNDFSQMFQLGLDHYKTEYFREDRPDGPRKNSETESVGVFINNQWTVLENLKINAGARYNNYQGRFRTDARKFFEAGKYWINGDSVRSEWDNHAYAFGLTYAMSPETSFFANYATSFRIPNVDEFAESEEGLKPQEGSQAEVGGRHRFGRFLSLTVALFDIRIDDEIYYSDINRNYDDKTIRQGIETDISIYPFDGMRLWGNYTYTEAKFDRQNTVIPLVPEHTASAGMNWQMTGNFSLSLSGTYVGSRYDGNDLQNDRYHKLDDYFVSNGKLSWQQGNLTVFAGIHNILNELYETSGYSEQYYPMPERTIYGGVRWSCL
jgi:iron complex outermembrane receptor protein